MLVRVITLSFDDVLGGFDDTFLQQFVRDKQVACIRDHFFVKEGCPYLAFVVTYTVPAPIAQK